jgi:hypothetical protein
VSVDAETRAAGTCFDDAWTVDGPTGKFFDERGELPW